MLFILSDTNLLFLQIIYSTMKSLVNHAPTQFSQQTLVMPLMETKQHAQSNGKYGCIRNTIQCGG